MILFNSKKKQLKKKREELTLKYDTINDNGEYKKCSEEYFVVETGKMHGLLDKEYNEIVPCIYEDIEISRNGFIIFKHNGKRGILSVISTCNNEEGLITQSQIGINKNALVITVQAEYIDIEYGIENLYSASNTVWNYLDKSQNWTFSYKRVEDGRYARMHKYAVMDVFGNILTHFAYTDIFYNKISDDTVRIKGRDNSTPNGPWDSYNYNIKTRIIEKIDM